MGQKLLRPVLTSGSPQGLNLEPRSLMGEHDTSTGRSAACCAQLWPRGAPCPPTPVASARPHGDPQRDQKRCPRAKLVVRFPLWTSTSSRIRHLKLKLPGTADRAVSLLHTLLPGALLFEASRSGHPSSILASNDVRPSAGAFNMSFWHFAGGMLLIEPLADQPLVLQPP